VSRRLRLLNLICARVLRPRLVRTPSPRAGAADFARMARMVFRRPRYLCAVPDLGAPVRMTRVTCGAAAVGPVVLYLHGGAYFSGSARTHLGLAGRLARLAGVEVAVPDYRLLQAAPFPAAFDDALAAWDHLRRGRAASDIVLAGDSAGGGLALAVLAHVLARGERPAGVVVFSPWTDLTLSGGSLGSAGEVLLPVERMAEVAEQYLAGAEVRDPRASPLFAGFACPPAVLIQVGSGEALRDDAVRMAEVLRAAGGVVDLRVWEDCPHVWQLFDGWIPEARAALREAAGFVQTSLARARR
jgi:acetyl esterase/lipase